MVARIYTFSRFKEPDHRDEPVLVDSCSCCGQELYEGDTAKEYDGELFCSESCVFDCLDIRDVIVGEE
jgi:hypothetical protein